MADAVDEMSLREQLVVHYKKVAAIGLNEGSSGNLSVRFGDRMLISPNGATEESIAVDTIVETSLDGDYRGDRLPSSEWRMHAAIYQKHADAGAVVHTHSDCCVAVASHEMPLPGFHYLVGVFGGDDVPCVPYSTFGRQKLSDDASEAVAYGVPAREPRNDRTWAEPEARSQPGSSLGDHVPAVCAGPTVGGTETADGRRLGRFLQKGGGNGIRQEWLTPGARGEHLHSLRQRYSDLTSLKPPAVDHAH